MPTHQPVGPIRESARGHDTSPPGNARQDRRVRRRDPALVTRDRLTGTGASKQSWRTLLPGTPGTLGSSLGALPEAGEVAGPARPHSSGAESTTPTSARTAGPAT